MCMVLNCIKFILCFENVIVKITLRIRFIRAIIENSKQNCNYRAFYFKGKLEE